MSTKYLIATFERKRYMITSSDNAWIIDQSKATYRRYYPAAKFTISRNGNGKCDGYAKDFDKVYPVPTASK